MTHSKESLQANPNIPGQLYLWLAVVIFGSSSAVTRKITEVGAQHFINGQNPISLCNVLFVGNLCALLILVVLYGQQWNRATLRQLSPRDWFHLVIVTLLSGTIAPALVFQALALTQVNNVVLIGRLASPLALVLSIWFLQERVNRWDVIGAIVSLLGVILTIVLQPAPPIMMHLGTLQLGFGEFLAAMGAIASAVATIIVKKHLAHVASGIYSIFRTAIGTVVFFFAALILYGSNHFMGAFSPFLWQWMLLYGAVIVVLGQSLSLRGLRATTVVRASIVSSFMPIVGVLSAYWLLGETPTQAQYIGGSIILIGLLFSQLGIRQASERTSRLQSLPLVKQINLETSMGFKGI